jgi:hypothetical protein
MLAVGGPLPLTAVGLRMLRCQRSSAAHSSWEGVQGMGASSRAAAWLTSIQRASTSPALPAATAGTGLTASASLQAHFGPNRWRLPVSTAELGPFLCTQDRVTCWEWIALYHELANMSNSIVSFRMTRSSPDCCASWARATPSAGLEATLAACSATPALRFSASAMAFRSPPNTSCADGRLMVRRKAHSACEEARAA